MTPATVATGRGPGGMAVSPDGGSVYVANAESFGNDTVSQYDVGADGALSPKNPPTVATGNSAGGVAVSPLPRVPTIKGQCRHGGWKQFGFKNQGRCIAFVNHGARG
jgi:DNA-binding beta-propeller fold protein YncE